MSAIQIKGGGNTREPEQQLAPASLIIQWDTYRLQCQENTVDWPILYKHTVTKKRGDTEINTEEAERLIPSLTVNIHHLIQEFPMYCTVHWFFFFLFISTCFSHQNSNVLRTVFQKSVMLHLNSRESYVVRHLCDWFGYWTHYLQTTLTG